MTNTLDEAPPAPPATSGGWLIWPMLLLLGYLLFAHGCHGDEDNKLFMRLGHVGPAQPGSTQADDGR